MVLSMYDISGIQKFIFASNKLKEQVGGSRIIHDILYKKLPEVLGETGEAWKENTDLLNFSGREHNIVYIGGGNAMVIYKDRDYMDLKTRELEKEVLKMTAGELKICNAFLDLDLEENKEKKYNELYADLMRALAKAKNRPSEIRLVTGLSIGEYDAVSLEPVTLLGEESGRKYGVVSHIVKREAFNCYKKESRSEIRFADQFEGFREAGKKSFVAVVHIDGDTMGKQIQRVMKEVGEKKSEEDNALVNSMVEMRKISLEIDSLYKEALESTLEVLYKEEKAEEKEIAFRKIITDGDDITFIIEAEKAFDFVESFMNFLEESRKGKKRIEENGFKISASAGIVFVHDKYPFADAYNMAESLCKSAKKVKKDREDEYLHISSMDFHIAAAGIKSGLEEFREDNYKKGDRILNIRPYFYDGKEEVNSYNAFKKLRKKVKDPNGIARSKLKGLRNAYGEGVQAAEMCHDLLLSREKEGITGRAEEKAFYGDESEWAGRACFFDALDSMDM